MGKFAGGAIIYGGPDAGHVRDVKAQTLTLAARVLTGAAKETDPTGRRVSGDVAKDGTLDIKFSHAADAQLVWSWALEERPDFANFNCRTAGKSASRQADVAANFASETLADFVGKLPAQFTEGGGERFRNAAGTLGRLGKALLSRVDAVAAAFAKQLPAALQVPAYAFPRLLAVAKGGAAAAQESAAQAQQRLSEEGAEARLLMAAMEAAMAQLPGALTQLPSDLLWFNRQLLAAMCKVERPAVVLCPRTNAEAHALVPAITFRYALDKEAPPKENPLYIMTNNNILLRSFAAQLSLHSPNMKVVASAIMKVAGKGGFNDDDARDDAKIMAAALERGQAVGAPPLSKEEVGKTAQRWLAQITQAFNAAVAAAPASAAAPVQTICRYTAL